MIDLTLHGVSLRTYHWYLKRIKVKMITLVHKNSFWQSSSDNGGFILKDGTIT